VSQKTTVQKVSCARAVEIFQKTLACADMYVIVFDLFKVMVYAK